MSEVRDAVHDVVISLYGRGYNRRKIAVYINPQQMYKLMDTVSHAADETELSRVLGCMLIEESPEIPRGIVVAIHLEAARHGTDAIAFKEINDV